MKIYTKVGDTGETSLTDGTIVPKYSKRVEAYGNIDELNSFVSFLRESLRAEKQPINSAQKQRLCDMLLVIQNELFVLGSEISSPKGVPKSFLAVADDSVVRLEKEIDGFMESVPPLRNFIIPGGHSLCSIGHMCRTICRRTERSIILLAHEEGGVRPTFLKYFNRLSDWLFALTRLLGQELKVDEIIWKGRKE
jgi:cob(I)alamin adenosyltransferase